MAGLIKKQILKHLSRSVLSGVVDANRQGVEGKGRRLLLLVVVVGAQLVR